MEKLSNYLAPTSSDPTGANYPGPRAAAKVPEKSRAGGGAFTRPESDVSPGYGVGTWVTG